MGLLDELRRRNVIRVAVAYIVLSWLLLQVGDVLFDFFAAPEWAGKLLVSFLILGFIPAALFAWAYELTPEGVKREADVDRSRSVTRHTGRKLDVVTLVALAGVVAFVLVERNLRPDATANSAVEAAATASKPTPERTETPAKDGTSIAVLPFVNMSSDPEQEYFSDGITEELLNRLVRIPDLRVAARTSSFQFKGEARDVGEIGQALNVAHVLEGSVRKAGNRLRITAQLIQVDSGFHLWSDTFERELTDVFAVQDEISGAIVAELESQLGTRAATAEQTRTADVDAFDLYLRGRHLLYQREAGNMRNAIDLFARAVEIDPGFVDAWASMAFTWALLPGYTTAVDPLTALAETRRAGERTLGLDPDNAMALTALGFAETQIGWNFDLARAYFDRAMALAPGNADVVNLYGDHLTITNAFAEGQRVEKRSMEMDPLSPVHPSDLCYALAIVHQTAEAVQYCRVAQRLAPDSVTRLNSLITALIMNGDHEVARETIDEVVRRLPDGRRFEPTWRTFLAYRSGNREDLRRWVDTAVAAWESGQYDFIPSELGFYLLALDGPRAALPWMERAYETRDTSLIWPTFFYRPRRYSSDPDWQAFWNKPELKAVAALQEAQTEFENVGFWIPPDQSDPGATP